MNFQKHFLRTPGSLIFLSVTALLTGSLFLFSVLLFYHPVKPLYCRASLADFEKEGAALTAVLTVYNETAEPSLNSTYTFELYDTGSNDKRVKLDLRELIGKQSQVLQYKVRMDASQSDTLFQAKNTCEGKLIVLEKSKENLLTNLIN